MKFLNINATINVKPQFDGEVLKAGTPLDISGAIANSDAAVGLVANDTAKGAESIAIVTEGTIDLTELTASYGSALTDECIAALKGITFLYGGKAVVPSGGGGELPPPIIPGEKLRVSTGGDEWVSGSDREWRFEFEINFDGEAFSVNMTQEQKNAFSIALTNDYMIVGTVLDTAVVFRPAVQSWLGPTVLVSSVVLLDSLDLANKAGCLVMTYNSGDGNWDVNLIGWDVTVFM